MNRILEIRTYTLNQNHRAEFLDLFHDQALPLLDRYKVDVVAFGVSLGDENGAFLMRAFSSLEAKMREEEMFYASLEWRDGPRAAILACIESFSDVVFSLEDAVIEAL